MSLDGFVVRNLVFELNNTIIESKIDKIYQPENDEIILHLRASSKNLQLLLSANSTYPRINITSGKYLNPTVPPSFCMFLRKHLTGGIIKKIQQINMDRVIMIEVASKNELRSETTRRIYIEIMGKHSNIILTDEKNLVLDCIKRISLSISSKRQVYPGIKYKMPNFDKKNNLLNINENQIRLLLNHFNQGVRIGKFLIGSFYGVSPLLSREVCFLSGIDDSDSIGTLNDIKVSKLIETLMALKCSMSQYSFKPMIFINPKSKEYMEFYCFDLKHLPQMERISYKSINEILDLFYLEKSKFISYKQKTSELRKRVVSLIDKYEKKLGYLKIELINAEIREQYKLFGDLILANMHKIANKDTELIAFDYLASEEIKIELDPSLNASKNAQKYYKKYNKLKNSEKYLKKQLKITQESLNYLRNILFSLEEAIELAVVDEIKEELYKSGYIKKSTQKKKPEKSKPLRIVTKDDFEIYIGKNNEQNDFLSFVIATKNDIWLHAKGVPGSHVIIRSDNREIPDAVLEEAAAYAAYYSRNRGSEKVEVDYTLKQNLKKPKNAKPGLVIFNENYSLVIEPKKPDLS
ncbi:MAG: Fibronectin/fibrinogen-binding protein [Clostridiales bacterium 38_11]|nr:MAG: Fibronectin/fibrinogen-binding protein [Clostridiales bacterium 38_11]HBH12153.1 fibronectin/fibrinogen-binding protein [Clostridiales bacterium]